jgi:hypothetical protein
LSEGGRGLASREVLEERGGGGGGRGRGGQRGRAEGLLEGDLLLVLGLEEDNLLGGEEAGVGLSLREAESRGTLRGDGGLGGGWRGLALREAKGGQSRGGTRLHLGDWGAREEGRSALEMLLKVPAGTHGRTTNARCARRRWADPHVEGEGGHSAKERLNGGLCGGTLGGSFFSVGDFEKVVGELNRVDFASS